MRIGFRWVLLSAWLLSGCTGRAEAVRAAQPYIEDFGHLRLMALDLLELRSDVQRRRLLAEAMKGDETSLPENLKPLLHRMRYERVQITDEELEHGEELFWRMLDHAFSRNPNVLQGEIILLEQNGSASTFRHPRERELPMGVQWYGLREHRTFAGLANCVTEDGSEACVLLQLRPRDYPGSAGLTVAYRRTPLEVTGDARSDR
ncbi:MAG: hypothetical protein WCE62_13090 [Polyangiales bacterium]